jgi:uncharacterized SAM-binding protein YcdF (DUF218 family)
MFYLASKIFWLVAQPLSIVLILMVAGTGLLALGRRRLGIAANGAAIVVLVLCGFTTLGFLVIQPLEDRFVRPDPMPENVQRIIVLGGSTLGRVSAARGVAELNEAGDRLTDAVILARRFPEARIYYSGGVGLIDQAGETEATTAERLLLNMGIAPDRIVLEHQSRNTDENADLTAALLEGSTGSTLLVTSAFHMPRAVGLFRRIGQDVIAWPTDYRSSGQEVFRIDLANPIHNFNTASIAMKEWIGLLAYHWTGRIASILPAQTSN